ncbi:MAG: Gfo/Idh/MocA family oxidoreductase [Limisphaerales bacterium]
MNDSITRRDFLKQSSAVTAGLAVLGGASPARAAKGPNDKVLVGVIGCHNRGMDHLEGYPALSNVEIAYVCDVDSHTLDKGLAAVAKKQSRQPKGVKDFRRILDDPEVDAVSIAMPDHWHTPATVLACAAGKHVYVEKPGSHNAHECGLAVAAARKYKRLVQLGSQRRSWPWVIDAIQSLRGGELGKLFLARGWYVNNRVSLGHAEPAPVPDYLDYDLWQGPAPEQPYRPNTIPYNWHWFWNWGTAELGNNGVHSLDMARWGMGIETAPRRVTCAGNRYHFKDDWQTPDVTVATFDFGDKCLIWEGQSCDPHGFEGSDFGLAFFGEGGSMVIAGTNLRVYDRKNKVVREVKGASDNVSHFGNFVDAIRNGTPLNADIADGHKSALLTHLGNISWRTGRTINFDPAEGKIVGDNAAAALWRRSYRPGWEPIV